MFTLSPTFSISRHRNTVQPGSRGISQYRLYYRRKIFLPSTDIISGSQNLLTRHTFVLALPVIPQISNIYLSALLLYYRNAPTTLRTRTLAPSMLKKDLGMRTEMNALNYMEFQVFQQVLGQGDLHPLEILLHMGSKLSLLTHVILWPSRKHFAIFHS